MSIYSKEYHNEIYHRARVALKPLIDEAAERGERPAYIRCILEDAASHTFASPHIIRKRAPK